MHHALPDDAQDVEAQIYSCNTVTSRLQMGKVSSLSAAQRVLILIGYPRGRMRFATQERAKEVVLSALDNRMNLLVESRSGI